MRKDNYVTMSFFKTHNHPVLTEAYEFNPTGKWIGLQKWLWKLLGKMGALKQFWDNEQTTTRIEFNGDDFGKYLMQSYSNCFPNTEPKHVYIGPREFDGLMYDREVAQKIGMAFSFQTKMGYNHKMFNLPVTVVPHMNGVLII